MCSDGRSREKADSNDTIHREQAGRDELKSESPPSLDANLVYDNDEEEPEIHTRTYLALVAMFTLNLVQVLALQGPPAVVSEKSHPSKYRQLNNTLMHLVILHRERSQ